MNNLKTAFILITALTTKELAINRFQLLINKWKKLSFSKKDY